MEPKFSTSFIPKQTLAESTPYKPAKHRAPRGALSLLFVVALVVFLGSAALGAIVFFNAQILERSLQSKRDQLQKAREAFQPELIREMTRLDQRLELANVLIANHLAPSEIFAALQEYTLQTIQFTSFTYTSDANTVKVSMSGKARSFSSIALQTDEFVKSRFVVNPVFSNFALQDNGEVIFSFSAEIDPKLVSYERALQRGGGTTDTNETSQ